MNVIRALAVAAAALTLAASSEDPEKGVSRDELARSHSVAQASQGAEGLTLQTMCTNCNEANLDLGGFGDAHIGVRRDGYRLCSGLPRIYAFSIFPSNAVEKLEIGSGPGLAEQPCDAIGGSIEVASQEPEKKPGLQLSTETGSYGWDKQALFADGRAGIFSGRLAATQSRFDAIDADNDGLVETGETDQWTVLAEMRVDLKKRGALSLGRTRIEDEQIGGRGQVELPFFGGGPVGYLAEDTFVDWTENRIGYEVELGRHQLHARFSDFERDQRVDAPPNFSSEPKQNRYNILQEDTYGELEWSGQVGSDWMLSAGWNTEEDVNTVSGGSMPIYLRVLEETLDIWGAFAQARVDLPRQVSLTFGTRYDDFEYSSCNVEPLGGPTTCETVGGNEWSPRASVKWKPAESFETRASFGYGLRAPRPIFNEICCGQAPERNTNVRPERASSLALDFSYQPIPALKLNTYLHRTEFEDYIIRMVAGSVDLKQKLVQGNIADATIEAITAFVVWNAQQSGVSLSGSFTWLDARNDGDTITLYPNVFDPREAIFPVTLPLEQIPYIAERKGNVSVRYASAAARYAVQAQAQYTGPMLIQQYDNVSGGFGVVPPAGLREDYRETPDFWLVNLSGRIGVHRYFDLILGVDNVFDYVQEDLDDFATDYYWGPLRGRYYYGGLGFRWGAR